MANNKIENKNINAVDKIIKILSYRDYISAWNKLSKKQRTDHMLGKYKFSYNLGADTKEAQDIKRDYMNGKLSDEQYMEFCNKHNFILERLG